MVVAEISDPSFPQGVAITPDGSRVYTANSGSNSVGVIDTSTNLLIATVGVRAGAAGIAITPNGARAYVTNNATTTVSVIDTSNNAVIDTITVGDAPVGIAVRPDGSGAFVANNLGGGVSVIDTLTNTVTDTIDLVQPVGVAVTPDGLRLRFHEFHGSRVGHRRGQRRHRCDDTNRAERTRRRHYAGRGPRLRGEFRFECRLDHRHEHECGDGHGAGRIRSGRRQPDTRHRSATHQGRV